MDDKEELYGKPDTTLTTFSDNPCEHFFIRKNATDIGCTKCTNHWIDGGEFKLKDGQIVDNPI